MAVFFTKSGPSGLNSGILLIVDLRVQRASAWSVRSDDIATVKGREFGEYLGQFEISKNSFSRDFIDESLNRDHLRRFVED